MMTDDEQLLLQYARERSESAFGELVTRHIDFVYSTALRVVNGDGHLAQDVAQTVFIELAREAGSLSDDIALAGWLHHHTCYTAAKAVRTERRRKTREETAMEMRALDDNTRPEWELVAPYLDESLDQLNPADRDALVLRFLKQQDLRAVGEALGISDDAARKRVDRALEKLHVLLKHRGATLSAAALGTALATEAVTAAPAGLAAAITIAALSGTTVTITAVIAATKAITMTTFQKTVVAATVAILAGTGIYESRQASALRGQNQTLQQQQAPLAEQIQQLQRERDAATNRLVSMAEEIASINTNHSELLRLRSKLGLLKQTATELSNQVTSASSQYGLLPGQMPPVTIPGVPATANAYARLVKKLATGQLSASEEFNLLKAWPYLQRRFSEPDAFASFQAQYLATTLDLKDDNVKWQLRQILERARDDEQARGLQSARMSDEEIQNSDVQLDIQKIRGQWKELNETTAQKIVQLLPEEQRSQLAANWQVLDFDPRLKSGSQASLAAPRLQNLNSQEVLQAFLGPNVRAVPATPLQKQ